MAGALKRLSQLMIDNPVDIGPGDFGVVFDYGPGDTGTFYLAQLTQNRYNVVPTASGGTLTVALRHNTGIDAQTNAPLYFKIGDDVRAVSAALSAVAAPATNWFNSGGAELATKSVDYFVYVGYNSTQGVSVGISRLPYGNSLADFSATGTASNYLHLSGTSGTASADPYTLIGRFSATLSAGTAYTWTVPTFTPSNLINRPIYETSQLSATMVLTGFSGTPTQTFTYRIAGRTMTFYLTISGTSSTTGFTASMPIAATSAANDLQRLIDNGGAVAGLAAIGASTITFYSSYAAGGWTASGTKGCEAMTKTVFI